VSGVSEPDEDRVVFMEDVVGGEQDQAAGGLGVEKHEAGRDPSTDRSGGLVQESAEEFQAPVLGRATAFDLVQSRQHEVLWGAARVDGPVEEGAEGALLVLVMAGVPVVDVGLGEVGESALVVDESGQELVGAGELLECVVAGAVGQGPAGGASTESGELVPGGEVLKDLTVRFALQFGEAAVQPAFEPQKPAVPFGEQPAGHEEIAQVSGSAPFGVLVECLVGERQCAVGEVGRHGLDLRSAKPDQS
jgi:hypothetical protein